MKKNAFLRFSRPSDGNTTVFFGMIGSRRSLQERFGFESQYMSILLHVAVSLKRANVRISILETNKRRKMPHAGCCDIFRVLFYFEKRNLTSAGIEFTTAVNFGREKDKISARVCTEV